MDVSFFKIVDVLLDTNYMSFIKKYHRIPEYILIRLIKQAHRGFGYDGPLLGANDDVESLGA